MTSQTCSVVNRPIGHVPLPRTYMYVCINHECTTEYKHLCLAIFAKRSISFTLHVSDMWRPLPANVGGDCKTYD